MEGYLIKRCARSICGMFWEYEYNKHLFYLISYYINIREQNWTIKLVLEIRQTHYFNNYEV